MWCSALVRVWRKVLHHRSLYHQRTFESNSCIRREHVECGGEGVVVDVGGVGVEDGNRVERMAPGLKLLYAERRHLPSKIAREELARFHLPFAKAELDVDDRVDIWDGIWHHMHLVQALQQTRQPRP